MEGLWANTGHIVAECPDKVKPSTSKKPYKKKALKATWDSKSESEEEVDVGTYFDEDLKTYVAHFIWSSNTRRNQEFYMIKMPQGELICCGL